jgi:cell division protein FtsL
VKSITITKVKGTKMVVVFAVLWVLSMAALVYSNSNLESIQREIERMKRKIEAEKELGEMAQ